MVMVAVMAMVLHVDSHGEGDSDGMVMRGDNRGQGDSDGCSHAR